MYKDLAHAVEELKKEGTVNLMDEEKFGNAVRKGEVPEQINDMSFVRKYRFDSGTDPGDESTLCIFEMPDKSRGFLILGFGMYKDPNKTALIDAIRKLENK